MFSITAESCRRFSLREILIMVAMNKAETVSMVCGRVQPKTSVTQRG